MNQLKYLYIISEKKQKYKCSFVSFKNKKRARRGALTRNE